jgi:hypothetical protein
MDGAFNPRARHSRSTVVATESSVRFRGSAQERCFAPEEGWTRHPQTGNCGAPKRALVFTPVNFRCVNKFRLRWVTATSNDDVCLRQSAAHRRSRKRVKAQDLAVKQRS